MVNIKILYGWRFFSTKTLMQMFRLSHNIYFVCLMLFIYHYYITKPNILASCLVLVFFWYFFNSTLSDAHGTVSQTPSVLGLLTTFQNPPDKLLGLWI